MDTKASDIPAAQPSSLVDRGAGVDTPVVGEAVVAAGELARLPGDKPPSAIPEAEIERMTADIIAALKTVYDPEIPSDIYELGLIYRIDIEDDKTVLIDMTLTSPGCPVAGEMPGWVQNAVNSVGGVQETKVNLVFDPPWHHGRMSDEARLALNMF
jgi:FeS assembly SUF system protein